ncbi:MAG: tetratricopeptide repeat protein, partial [Geminicoccaceae bacterium]
IFRADYATSLNDLAGRLSEDNNLDQANQRLDQALEIWSRLIEEGHDVRKGYARALAFKAELLDHWDPGAESISYSLKALSAWKEIFFEDPHRWLLEMKTICAQHMQRCKRLHNEHDQDLLWPIIRAIRMVEAE